MSHFLQSTAWEAFQHAIGKTTLRDSSDDWSYMGVIESSRLASRLYCPYGPECNHQQSLTSATESLKKAAKRHKLDYIRIEPTGAITAPELKRLGYRKVASSQPEHTWCVDVRQTSKEQLLAQMSQPNRNSYRNYSRKGLVVHRSTNPDDVTILVSLLTEVASRNSIKVHTKAYFRSQAETLMKRDAAMLYYVTFDNEPIAAALVFDSDSTRYYAHAAASHAHRKLNAGAIIVSTLIIDAHEKGLQTVDLYGITDSDDPTHPWAGFTKFKKSFGGYPVKYVGRWELPIRPFRYAIYRSSLRLYQLLPK